MKRFRLGQKTNIWKWCFIGLLAINLGFILIVGNRLFQKVTDDSINLSSTSTSDIKVGTVTTTREQLNETIASYLESYQNNTKTYKTYITSSGILFETDYTLLGYEMPLSVYFQPYKLDSGDIQLKVTSFSVGTLSLPEKEVLQYIKSSVKLPDFIQVLPNKSVITIKLQKINTKETLYLKSNVIDLVNDNISFDIYKKKN